MLFCLQETSSFCMNLFRGKTNIEQIFPYPLDLDSERREMLQMIIPPITKFLEEVNNPSK